MPRTVNVNYVTKEVKILLHDSETESLAAATAIAAAESAQEAKDVVVDNLQDSLDAIDAKTETEKTELDGYTETKKTEIATLGQGYVDSASQKVAEANTILSAIRNEYGYPFTAATAAAMTDPTKIYIYTGSETGYTNGDWYYYNGSAWVSGGTYNAVAFTTDTTLTISGAAADAQVTGDRLNIISDEVLTYTEMQVSASADGWRLVPATGLCESDASYNLVKYAVTEGKPYKVVSDDYVQFQSAASVPSYGTSNRIGDTYSAGTFYVTAPTGATYLIFSTPTTDSVAKAYEVAMTVDPTLSISGEPADAKVTGAIRDAVNIVVDVTDYTWQLGTIDATGSIVSANTRVVNTDLIPVTEGTRVVVGGNANCLGVYYYDVDKNFIGSASDWESESIIPNNGTAYIRATIRKTSYNSVIDASEITTQAQRCDITLKYNRSTALLHYGNEDIKKVIVDTDALEKMQGNNFLSNAVWSIGGISILGEEYATYTRIRCNAIDISSYQSIRISVESGYKFVCNFYDENNVFLSTSDYVFDSWYKEVPANAKFVRISMGIHPDSNTATLSWATKLTAEGFEKLLATVIRDNQKLTDVALFGNATWERGTLDNNGDNYESTSRIRTVDYLDVTSNKAILFDIDGSYKISVVSFDANHNKVTSTGWLYQSSLINISPNVSYIRIIMSAEPDLWLADASISQHLRIYDNNKYSKMTDELNGNLLIKNWFCATSVNKCEIPPLQAGTTILALGDSITAETTSAGWVYHFQNMTGCTIIDRAIGGTTFGESATDDSGHWMMTQVNNVTTAQWESADMVIVACGTNDYGHGTPLTELKTKVQEVITAIKSKTNVPIVFITPIRRGNTLTDDPMLKMPVIAGIISNVALANQCNVVCGFDFPIPTYTTGLIDNMTRDGLHPVATGANVYARTLIGFLK